MFLESERLILRRFAVTDASELFDYLSDDEVVRFEPYEPISPEDAFKEAESRSGNESFIAVCVKESGKLIGNLYFSKIKPDFINTYEIGYVFNKHYHGMGYATEAAGCLLNYIFNTKKAHRVIALCNPENNPSWMLLERLGFRREAEYIESMFFKSGTDGRPLWFNSYQYALLAREFNSAENTGRKITNYR